MAKLTVPIDISKVEAGLENLEWDMGNLALTEICIEEAQEIINESKLSPIPFKHGYLENSWFIDTTPFLGIQSVAGAQFGFGIIYATVQDIGMPKGRPPRPKFYGSEKGPNYYFSETWKRRIKKTAQGIRGKIAAILVSKARRTTKRIIT